MDARRVAKIETPPQLDRGTIKHQSKNNKHTHYSEKRTSAVFSMSRVPSLLLVV